MQKEKFGFVYIWRDKFHNRFYIGSHWGHPNDGYICSSTWMRNAHRRRPQDFKRRILSKVYTTRRHLLIEEQKWLDLIPKEELSKRYYNHKKGSTRYAWWTDPERVKTVGERISKSKMGHLVSEETRKKFSERLKGKPRPDLQGKKRSEETCQKLSKAARGRRGFWVGKKFSDTTKQKLSTSHKGLVPWNKGRVGISEETHQKMREAKLGKKHSEESKKKRSERLKGKPTPMAGIPVWNKGKNVGSQAAFKAWETKRRINIREIAA